MTRMTLVITPNTSSLTAPAMPPSSQGLTVIFILQYKLDKKLEKLPTFSKLHKDGMISLVILQPVDVVRQDVGYVRNNTMEGR